jgi:hypothetical protein
MNFETISTLILGALGGGALKIILDKGIDWLRFRTKDKAETAKTIHDSHAQAITVSTTLLAQWIQTASDAMQKINEKDASLKEVQHALGLCKESMKRCRDSHGCSE